MSITRGCFLNARTGSILIKHCRAPAVTAPCRHSLHCDGGFLCVVDSGCARTYIETTGADHGQQWVRNQSSGRAPHSSVVIYIGDQRPSYLGRRSRHHWSPRDQPTDRPHNCCRRRSANARRSFSATVDGRAQSLPAFLCACCANILAAGDWRLKQQSAVNLHQRCAAIVQQYNSSLKILLGLYIDGCQFREMCVK